MYITCCFWFKPPECLVTDVLLFCHSCGYEKVFSDQENRSDLQPSWFKLSSPPPRTKNTAFAYCQWLITVGGSLNGSAVINSDKRLLPNWSWIWSPLTDLTSSPYSHWPSSLLTLPSDQPPSRSNSPTLAQQPAEWINREESHASQWATHKRWIKGLNNILSVDVFS